MKPCLAGGLAAAALCGAVWWLAGGEPESRLPLWVGSRFTAADRGRAVTRGVCYLYTFARRPDYFERWGFDLLSCFEGLANTSQDARLRRMARAMGAERGRAWVRRHPAKLPVATGDDLLDLLYAFDAARHLDVTYPGAWEQLLARAPRFPAAVLFDFDPAREAPPADVPRRCERCGQRSPRGSRVCVHCGGGLEMFSPHLLWMNALIATYTAERNGVPLATRYAEVVRWASTMRPYPGTTEAFYAATHLVYTRNGYGARRVAPPCLPDEYAFLRAQLPRALTMRDVEAVSECLDTLCAFGLTPADGDLRAGFEFLLGAQNADGSWGDPADTDPYNRYHATWTAVDALREHRWEPAAECAGSPR